MEIVVDEHLEELPALSVSAPSGSRIPPLCSTQGEPRIVAREEYRVERDRSRRWTMRFLPLFHPWEEGVDWLSGSD